MTAYVREVIIYGCCSDYMDRFLDEGEAALLYGKTGVAPPIPTSTIASATIAVVSSPEHKAAMPDSTTSPLPPTTNSPRRSATPPIHEKRALPSFAVDAQNHLHQPETIAL